MSVEFNKSGVILAGEFGELNTNIIPNSRTMALGTANASTGTWRDAGSNTMTKSRVQITDSPIGSCYGFQNVGIQTANDGSCYGIDLFPLDPNSYYVISMWAKCAAGNQNAMAGFNIYSSTHEVGTYELVQKNYYGHYLPTSGEWKRVWIRVKTNAATTRNIYIGIVTGDTPVTTQMCGIKIEKGYYPTSWSPNPADGELIIPAKIYEDYVESQDFIEY